MLQQNGENNNKIIKNEKLKLSKRRRRNQP